MSKLLIGAGIAAIVALGYAFFHYENRCPTPAEIDKIVSDVKGNRLATADAELIARELDRRKCVAQAMQVRQAISTITSVDNAKAAADKAIADKAIADKAAADAKPKCPAIFARLPDAPIRRARNPGDPPPFGIASIRAWAAESFKLYADNPTTRDSHATILELEAPFWSSELPSNVFADAAKCLRGLVDAPLSPSTLFVAGMDPRRRVVSWTRS